MPNHISYFDNVSPDKRPPQELIDLWLDKPVTAKAGEYHGDHRDQGPILGGQSSYATRLQQQHYFALMLQLVISIKDTGKRYTPNGLEEQLLSRNGKYSLDYALAIGQPFPPGELAISLNRAIAIQYAVEVLKPAGINRFAIAEPVIAEGWIEAAEYATTVTQRRFELAEAKIMQWAPLAVLGAYDDIVRAAGEATPDYEQRMVSCLLAKKYSIEDEDSNYGKQITKLYQTIGFSSEVFNIIRSSFTQG